MITKKEAKKSTSYSIQENKITILNPVVNLIIENNSENVLCLDEYVDIVASLSVIYMKTGREATKELVTKLIPKTIM